MYIIATKFHNQGKTITLFWVQIAVLAYGRLERLPKATCMYVQYDDLIYILIGRN